MPPGGGRGGRLGRQEYKGDKLEGISNGPQLLLPTQSSSRAEDVSFAQLVLENCYVLHELGAGKQASKTGFPGLHSEDLSSGSMGFIE